jgi:hypothetical protein
MEQAGAHISKVLETDLGPRPVEHQLPRRVGGLREGDGPVQPGQRGVAKLCALGAALRMIRQGAAGLGRKLEDIRVAGRGCDLRIKLC